MNLIEAPLRHPGKVSPEHTQSLLDTITRKARLIQRDFNFFVEANDNFPAMGCFIMVAGGELVGDDQAVQAGLDSFYSPRDLLVRRWRCTECTSRTVPWANLPAACTRTWTGGS